MNPMPVNMRDRWSNRVEQDPGSGTIYWHMLVSGYPEVRATAEEAQRQLSQFVGLHMTPPDWLHVTTLVAGTTSDISDAQMSVMITEAQCELAGLKPIQVTLDKVLYHPEAIMLSVQPRDALLPVLQGVRNATRKVTGSNGRMSGSLPTWTPHITLSYSTTDQPAGPIISALGTNVDRCEVTIRSVSLVIQWGPERSWNWQQVGTVYFDETHYDLP